MIYVETIFDICYLMYAIVLGFILLKKQNDDTEKMMAKSILMLGIGDAFHLIPRILSNFRNRDLSLLLGVGKLATSLTMTIFYVYLYHIYLELLSPVRRNKKMTITVYILTLVRIIA